MDRFFDVLMLSLIAAIFVVIFVTGAGTTKVIVPTFVRGWLQQLQIVSGNTPPAGIPA